VVVAEILRSLGLPQDDGFASFLTR
jgi:hypothetical protein